MFGNLVADLHQQAIIYELPPTRRSQRHDLYIPGIHLDHSVDPVALAGCGMNQPVSPIQIIDASALSDIGSVHHSFKLMLLAYARARRAHVLV
jgi:hypothetical protein